MQDRDELKEKRDSKEIKSNPHMTEYGDRLEKSDIYAGISIMISVAAMAACACIGGCNYVKKQIRKYNKTPAVQVMTNTTQNVR